MASPCDLPGIGQLCHAAGNATTSVAGGAFDAVAKAFAQGLADVMKVLITFWLHVPEPDLTSGSSAVAALNGLTRPLVAFAAIVGVLVAGARMAVTTQAGESARGVLRGLLLMVGTSAAGAGLVALLLTGCDALALHVLASGFDGQSVGTRMAKLGALPTVGGGLLFVLALFGMLASLTQVAMMVIRGAVLAVLVGILPVAAAASITGVGFSWYKRLWGWIGSFVVYKLAAAVIYAAAFTMIADGRDLAGVVGGFALLAVAVLALPALLRLLPPSADAIASGGGGALAGAGAAAATGAVTLGGRLPAGPAPTQAPGLAGGSSAAAGGGAPSGASAVPAARSGGEAGASPAAAAPAGSSTAGAETGAAGSSGAAAGAAGSGAASSGAAAAGGPAGAAVQAGQQAYSAAKSGAEKAAGGPSGSAGGESA
jgi:hypothetical protein